MFFDEPNNEIEILSVLKIKNGAQHAIASNRGFHALSVRLSGEAVFTVEGNATSVSSGDIIYIPAHLDYRIDSCNDELIVIHFNLRKSNCSSIDVFRPSDGKYFQDKFISIHRLWLEKKPGYTYECKAALYKALARAISLNHGPSEDLTSKKLEDTVEYIHEHYTDKDLNVEHLFRMASMSDTYYRRLFVARCGMTPLKYINSLRVSLALELLSSGYYTVTQTAEKCGFDSQSYFSTIIKNETGLSPSAHLNKKASDNV